MRRRARLLMRSMILLKLKLLDLIWRGQGRQTSFSADMLPPPSEESPHPANNAGGGAPAHQLQPDQSPTDRPPSHDVEGPPAPVAPRRLRAE
eukprot:10704258-Karenia_brevis.AAC.1